MHKRRVLLMILGVILLIVAAFLLWPGPDEPKYQGRELHEIIDQLGVSVLAGKPVLGDPALAAIGTNGIPFYLHWMAYRPGKLDNALARFRGSRVGLSTKWICDPKGRSAGSAAALALLGPLGEPAMPTLLEYARDSRNSDRAYAAILSLVHIGAAATPLLRSFLNDTNQGIDARYFAACLILEKRAIPLTMVEATRVHFDPEEIMTEAVRTAQRRLNQTSTNPISRF